MELFTLWFIGAIVVGIVAGSRGRSGFGYFLLSMLLSPVIGLVLAVALPSVATISEGQLVSDGTHTRCPECRELVRHDARKCKHCGSSLTAEQA